jgi:hypothetical protein
LVCLIFILGINKGYEWVIKPQFDGVKPFENGYAQLTNNNNSGIVDKSGKIVVPLQYECRGNYSCGLVLISQGYERYNYVDASGKLLNQSYYKSASSFVNGMGTLQDNNGEWYWIDNKGNIIKSLGRFSGFGYYSDLKDDMILVSEAGMKGFLNSQGQEVISKKYEDAFSFSEGLAAVKQNGSWGYIDKNGNWVTQPKFTYVVEFTNGYASVKDNNKLYGIIDKKGNLIMQHFSKWGLGVSNNVVLTEIEKNRQVYLNLDGSKFIEQEFESAQMYSEELATAKLNGKWCVLDKTGKIIPETDLFFIGMFKEGVAIARETKDGKFGNIKLKGTKTNIPIYQNGKRQVQK